jgi:hypothetical protein
MPFDTSLLSSMALRNFRCAGVVLLLCFLFASRSARAQGGPPLLTNDPGTPGNTNWENNFGFVQVLRQHENVFQVPQIDLNYGLGDRIQLTFEVPYVLVTAQHQPLQTGWTNAQPGVKWRFYDGGEDGWQLSVFPQAETNGPRASVKKGIADRGPRFLLPFEVTKKFGPVHLDFEAGYWFPVHGHEERIIGFAAGHKFTPKLELIGEIYNDSAMGVPPHDTTFDLGGRYEFHKGLLFLFAAGRSFSSPASGQPQFIGYFGLQVLLTKYGRRLNSDE